MGLFTGLRYTLRLSPWLRISGKIPFEVNTN
jgi:hypothetical protein